MGRDVPLHFSAFHPDFKLMNKPRTPSSTLSRARRIAREEGLRYVYTGNVHDRDGDATYCPGCGKAVIERDWYNLLAWNLRDGACRYCGHDIAGVFEADPGGWGARRMAIRIPSV